MKERICIVGKVPPLQGGVSRLTLETARRLAQGGYEVHIVTNAGETECFFKQRWHPNDEDYFSRLKTEGVFVHHLSRLDEKSHIPFSPCYETRMCGRIIEIVREFECRVIVGWYLQPYGVAAAFAAQYTSRPYILMHAGSDLAYLAEHPDLNSVYRHILRDAAVVIHSPKPEVKEHLKRLGVPETQLSVCSGFADISALIKRVEEDARTGLEALSFERFYRELGAESPVGRRENLHVDFTALENCPQILCAGKISPSKNYRPLFLALEELARRGIKFHVIQTLIGREDDIQEYLTLVNKLRNVRKRLTIIPPISPWRLQTLMKRVDVGVYLEGGFSMDFHTSGLPMEFLASGTALLISREGVNQGVLRGVLRNDLNAKIIEDPTNVVELRTTIEDLLSEPAGLAEMKKLGRVTIDQLNEKVREERELPLISEIITDFVEAID